MSYELPYSLEVNGVWHPIRTDFRDIMRIMLAMNDPNLTENEKAYICLYIIYEDFEDIPGEDYEAAFKAASYFLDCGDTSGAKPSRGQTVDFEQDERLLIAAVNRVAGKEVRDLEYLHWWTFMGYFMEIGDCTYSRVLSLRSKRNEGKKFESWEKEFWDEHRDICVIRKKLSDEDIAFRELTKKLLG